MVPSSFSQSCLFVPSCSSQGCARACPLGKAVAAPVQRAWDRGGRANTPWGRVAEVKYPLFALVQHPNAEQGCQTQCSGEGQAQGPPAPPPLCARLPLASPLPSRKAVQRGAPVQHSQPNVPLGLTFKNCGGFHCFFLFFLLKRSWNGRVVSGAHRSCFTITNVCSTFLLYLNFAVCVFLWFRSQRRHCFLAWASHGALTFNCM